MLVKLLSRIDRSRFDSVVVTLTEGGALRERLDGLGVGTASLGMTRGRPTASGAFRLLRLLRKLRPEVVQTWLYHADLLGLVAARITRVPHCVWNIRVSNLDMERYSRVSRWTLRACARLSGWPDLVLVNSATAREFHTALGYRPRRWKVVPNGFDTDRFRPDPVVRESFRASMSNPDVFLVGLVARYDPMKDHPTFLRAARAFLADRPEARFLLVGPGVDENNAELVEMACALGVRDALTCLGERRDMHAILPAMDVLTLSSAFGEGFSNAVGEGMSCGVPPVVTDVGDMADVVGTAGRVVPPSDPVALARAWEEMYEMGDEGRRALGVAARRRIVDAFGLQRVVAEYEQIYAALTSA